MKTFMIMHRDERLNGGAGGVVEAPACGMDEESARNTFVAVRKQAGWNTEVLAVRELKRGEPQRERVVQDWELERLGLKGTLKGAAR